MSAVADIAPSAADKPAASSTLTFAQARNGVRYAGFWIFLTLLTTTAGLLADHEPASLAAFAATLAVHAGFWFQWSIVAAVAYAISRRVVPSLQRGWSLAYAALTLGTAASLALYYAVLYADAPQPRPGAYDHDALWFLTIDVALFLFVVFVAISLRRYRHEQAREAARQLVEIERQRLAAAVSEGRLTALRGQIHPHFIFNALNSIAFLVEAKKTDAAYDAVTSLADILRQTFVSLDQKTIALGAEFKLVRDMFELGRLRFGDRFTWHLDLPEALAHLPVQPFLIQPLAENALLHAVGRSDRAVRVDVRAAERDGRLVLEVSDDGMAIPDATLREKGVGLANLRERLALIGGTLAVVRHATGFAATVTLPKPDPELHHGG